MEQIVMIDGWWGSGKSTLRGLLDGHPELMVSPVQDAFFGGLAQVPNLNAILEMKDLGEFRKAVWGCTDYSRYEKEALSRGVFNFSGGSTVSYNTFDFDFYGFDRAFTESLLALETWTVEGIARMLYDLVMRFWRDESSEARKAAVSMENNYDGALELLLRETHGVKYIWVDRSSFDVTAVHANREVMENSVGTRGWGNKATRHVVKDGRIYAHEKKRDLIRRMQDRYPERVKLLPLEDVVLKTSETMETVAEFLGIPHLPILDRYTFRGNDFEGSDRFVGKINDTAASLFTEDQMVIIEGEVRAAARGKKSWLNQKRACMNALRAGRACYRSYFGRTI